MVIWLSIYIGKLNLFHNTHTLETKLSTSSETEAFLKVKMFNMTLLTGYVTSAFARLESTKNRGQS